MANDEQESETEAEPNDETEREGEQVMSRADGAEILCEVANGVENGTINIEGENGFTVAVPEHFELEVESRSPTTKPSSKWNSNGKWKTANRYRRTNNTVDGVNYNNS